MKLVYVAGPYTAEHAYLVKDNIRRAEVTAEALMIATDKAYPVVPHKNTEHLEGMRSGDWFIEGTKELMRRCDAVLIVQLSDWESSVGTLGEIEEAGQLDIPVFYTLQEIVQWLEDVK